MGRINLGISPFCNWFCCLRVTFSTAVVGYYTHYIHVRPCPIPFFRLIHPLKNIFLVTMNDLRQQNRRGSHKVHVDNHFITSHLLPSLMTEQTAFLKGEHTWSCLMLHHTITASTCNVLWLSFSFGTCLRACHHSGMMNGHGCNLHRPTQFGKKVYIPSHSGLLLAAMGIDDVHILCICCRVY